MKILIIGSGVAGSALADLLTNTENEVIVLEKDISPGGMCKSYYKDGFTYEYGPHILANHHSTAKAKKYLTSKIDVVNTQLTTASFLKKTLTYYPPSIYSAKKLGLFYKVKNEIALLPKEVKAKNFEEYLIKKVGKTLYLNFFKNFTEKFWQIQPSKLSVEWAKTRRLGESINEKKMFFNNIWCSYPKKDWNVLFMNCLKNVRVIYDAEVKKINYKKNNLILKNNYKIDFDLCISSMNIDEMMQYKFGKLDYAGYRISPKIIKKSERFKLDNKAISMTYFPEKKYKYCRISDYGTFQKKTGYPYNDRTILTYEYPDKNIRLYPFTDKKNNILFNKYLIEISKYKSIITFGRLGLYKYLTSDTTVEMAFRLLPNLKKWKNLSQQNRYKIYKYIRGGWNN